MSAPTLVLPPRYSDDSNSLWRAALRLDWPVERLQSWQVPETLLEVENVAIYGESLWANHVAEQLGLELYEPPLDWLATLPLQFLRRKVGFQTLERARHGFFPQFVKPAGDKTFEARVYEASCELPISGFWPDNLPVLTSEVVEWDVEYRCFCFDGRVQTASSYWHGETTTKDENGAYFSLPGELEAATDFAHRVLQFANFPTGTGVVIDVGQMRGDWAVIEANPAFGAGIYGCDPAKVLETIARCPRRRGST